MTYQLPLPLNIMADFPSTRYQGSKAKLSAWICEQIADIPFHTCLDAFGGTGAVSFQLKQAGKAVTFNDILRFNYLFARALIENDQVRLSPQEIEDLLTRHPDVQYPTFVQDTFSDIYFTDDENTWIDQTITNLRRLEGPYKFALGFFALCQACIVKRPYNLFHRKNLYMRFAEVERSFGNKASWDRPFDDWFQDLVQEANRAVFANDQENRAINMNALAVPGDYDLVYIDPPYISRRGVGVDYRDFYHFLEGLAIYDDWHAHVDYKSKHRRLKSQKTAWTNSRQIHDAFGRVFHRFQRSHLVVSYRSDGIPPIEEIAAMLGRYKDEVRVEHFGQYKYALSTNSRSKEVLLIAT